MNEYDVFPERLRKLREHKRLKRAVLSELCGLGKMSVSRYERSEIVPSVESLIKIADFFDVSIDYLVGRSKNK